MPLACLAGSKTFRLSGSVHPGRAPFKIVVHAEPNGESGFNEILSVEITSGGRHVQSIVYKGEEKPTVSVLSQAVVLADINCDGFKDLLVQYQGNNHGNAWYHLYLFEPAKGIFVSYDPFSELPFRKANCHSKTITTYVNEGAAGCEYTSGEYRWSGKTLIPIRMETQANDGNTDEFIRTVETWMAGKRRVDTKKISGNDCHK